MAATKAAPTPASAAPPAPRAKAADAPAGDVNQERLAFVAKALLGCTVDVTVRAHFSAAVLGLLAFGAHAPARRGRVVPERVPGRAASTPLAAVRMHRGLSAAPRAGAPCTPG